MRSSRAPRNLVLAVALAAAALCATPGASRAQPAGNIDLNVFRPAMDSRGYITVNASQVLGHGDISFGLGALDWGYRLLRFEDDEGDVYSIDNIITATLVVAYGLKFGPVELELGGSLPVGIVAGDRDPDSEGMDPTSPNDDENFALDGQGFGSAGLHLKTRFLKTSRGPKIGLGVIASVYFPSFTKDEWLGEDQVVPQIVGILDKEFGRERRFRVSLNGGIRLRSDESVFVDDDTGPDPTTPITNRRTSAGNEIPFGFGMAYAISPQKFDVVAEVIGAYPLEKEDYQPLEAIAGVKLYLARNSFLSLGGGIGLQRDKTANPDARAFIGIVFEPNIGDRDGDGIKDDVDSCPAVPEDFDDFEDEDGCPEADNDRDGIPDVDDRCPDNPEDKDDFEDEDGCPEGNENDRDGDGILDDVDKCPDDPEDIDQFEDEDGCPDPDNDQDGILDVDDLCPNDPEDKDGFEDEDGCPDLDNDKDRIKDVDDRCPNEPETYNGVEDDDGCPDRGRVVVTDTKIEILDKVYFEYNKAKIKSESFPILDAVAATLEGNPDIVLIEIQGHTDERGNDDYNLELSDKRAKAVMQYLVDKGISENRLTAQGYGETQPILRKKTEEAYAKNRRVEFLILKRTND
jgi:OmpA-OmpF porin, OOP family